MPNRTNRVFPAVLAVLLIVSAAACGGGENPRTYLIRGSSGKTRYSAWTEGSTTCLAIASVGGDNEQVCQPPGVASPGEVGFGLVGHVVFGISRTPFARVLISDNGGGTSVIPGMAASGGTGWLYFVGGSPPSGSVYSFQLLDEHGKPLEIPQSVPFGKTPGAVFVPEMRLQQ